MTADRTTHVSAPAARPQAAAVTAQARVRAANIVDWTHRDHVFWPVDDGLRGRIMSWATYGRAPAVGTVLGLKGDDGGMRAYRVTGYEPSHAAADYDGFMILVEFVPGRDIDTGPSS